MPTTSFNPPVHGFRFSNNDLALTGWPLCGGMAYSAIDYFAAGLPIPPIFSAPAKDTPLYDYIYGRQVDAHVNTGAKFAGLFIHLPVITPLITGFSTNPDEELAKLAARLNTGIPCPVCLAGAPFGGGHHLVAISCNANPPILITAYDPNAPGRLAIVQEIKQPGAAAKKFTNSASGKTWDHFFCDSGYAPQIPSVLPGQENWRWCNLCMGLYYAGHGSNGACPRGGPHVSNLSANYWLNHKAGPGQGNWRWCRACEGLFFAGSGSLGVCPQNPNGHDGSQSGEYFLPQGGGDQGQWFWCQACQGLYFAGSTSRGVCPNGPSGHDGTKSGGYFLSVTSG